jgi:hypothetical protein
MSLTFILSDTAYNSRDWGKHNRIELKIDLLSGSDKSHHVSDHWYSKVRIGNRTLSPDMKERILVRLDAIPSDLQQTLTDKPCYDKPLSTKAINDLYSDSSEQRPNFQELFHHAEVCLLELLETDEFQDIIIEKIKEGAGFVKGCKVYAVILNIASPAYCCPNCEMGILGEQNDQQSDFLQRISKKLVDMGCYVPNVLRMVTCVSSKYPCTGRNRVNKDDHQTLTIDLRRHYGNLFFQRDLEQTQEQRGSINSRKSNRGKY